MSLIDSLVKLLGVNKTYYD